MTAYLTLITFATILYFFMMPVNMQLALFFEQVGIEGYPKKGITAIIVSNVLFTVNSCLILILQIGFKINVPFLYIEISIWLNKIPSVILYLTQTVAFYLLADFGFETR